MPKDVNIDLALDTHSCLPSTTYPRSFGSRSFTLSLETLSTTSLAQVANSIASAGPLIFANLVCKLPVHWEPGRLYPKDGVYLSSLRAAATPRIDFLLEQPFAGYVRTLRIQIVDFQVNSKIERNIWRGEDLKGGIAHAGYAPGILLHRLETLQNLQSLSLSVPLSLAAIAAIHALPSLERLDLSECPGVEAGTPDLPSVGPPLRTLALSHRTMGQIGVMATTHAFWLRFMNPAHLQDLTISLWSEIWSYETAAEADPLPVFLNVSKLTIVYDIGFPPRGLATTLANKFPSIVDFGLRPVERFRPEIRAPDLMDDVKSKLMEGLAPIAHNIVRLRGIPHLMYMPVFASVTHFGMLPGRADWLHVVANFPSASCASLRFCSLVFVALSMDTEYLKTFLELAPHLEELYLDVISADDMSLTSSEWEHILHANPSPDSSLRSLLINFEVPLAISFAGRRNRESESEPTDSAAKDLLDRFIASWPTLTLLGIHSPDYILLRNIENPNVDERIFGAEVLKS
ncbi:hypothetical protein HMN09_00350900 [Mycena chlorophos]|uniref:F-box domain-containing protein n=1 Tax=Mycena chlorophos TaxID=658473 RepID=A0A8H6TKI6_MYCCL|nr:hypothetical protein HMN09_00350900 [Mycena chlorophos]